MHYTPRQTWAFVAAAAKADKGRRMRSIQDNRIVQYSADAYRKALTDIRDDT